MIVKCNFFTIIDRFVETRAKVVKKSLITKQKY